MPNDYAKRFLRQLLDQGFLVEVSGGNHLRITRSDMQRPVFAARSPSDTRSTKNAWASIRRSIKRDRTNG